MLFYRTEIQEKYTRLQTEAEQTLQQLEKAELKLSAADKQSTTVGAQLAEAQVRIIHIQYYICFSGMLFDTYSMISS